jgi:hypothetical protein
MDMKKFFNIIILGALFFTATGCSDDFLERTPTNSVTDDELFSSITGAQTALEGIHRSTYKYYGWHSAFGQKATDMIIDLMGEDFYPVNDSRYRHFYNWYKYLESRNINSDLLEYVWAYYYDIIDNANIIIEKIDNAADAGTKEDQAKNIKGQAYTYRAYSLWYLVQLFAQRYEPGGANAHAGVPVVVNTSGEALPRATVAEVYRQINEDLDEAISLLGQSTTVRPNKSHINLNVARAVKARVALTVGDWSAAAAEANKARQGYPLTTSYDSGWNDASDPEWIWGALLIDEQQTSYASFFSQIDPFFGGYATLGIQKSVSTEVFDYLQDTDVRKKLFQADVYYPDYFQSRFLGLPRVGYKFSGYGEWTNDYLYLKAGELYLIEAEALARQGKNAEAQEVIYELTVNRNPEAEKPAVTGDELISRILLERRAELWGDGFRLLDIKRLNTGLDRRNQGHNELIWEKASNFPAGDKNLVFLIPQQEIDSNPQIIQNDL